MNIVQPSVYQIQTKPKSRQWIWWVAVSVATCIVAGLTCNYLRPLPTPTATLTLSGLSASHSPTVAWPVIGQAAIGAPNYGILDTHGTQSPLATASVTKVILALCVLDKSPIEIGKTGKIYTITADDVANYNRHVAGNGSVAAVAEGEELSEYQAIEALMIPSANNIADSLAKWEFGSNAGYAAYAANYLANHQINNTVISSTDASGYDADTTSTASDLTKIGLLALQNPVLMKIAGQKSTTLPVAGLVNNYNTVLGINGITGLKTGNNDADPGAFLFTADLQVGTEIVKATGAVMGANDLQSALDSATRISASMQQSFEQSTIAVAGQTVGTMSTAWGENAPIITSKKLELVRWQDTAFKEAHRIRATTAQGNVGALRITAPGVSSETVLQLKHTIPGPSFWWRLTRH